MAILSHNCNSSNKFWQLEKRINEDKMSVGVMCDMRRSAMLTNIVQLINEGVIEFDDMDEFSGLFKDTVMKQLKCND
jgi:hypothetical protein